MAYNIKVRVDDDHSVDPSYIIHYQVTDNESLVGDGTVEYNSQAKHNDIPVNENIPPKLREEVRKQIIKTTKNYINQQH